MDDHARALREHRRHQHAIEPHRRHQVERELGVPRRVVERREPAAGARDPPSTFTMMSIPPSTSSAARATARSPRRG